MNKIVSKEKLAESIFRYSIENRDIAKARKPGQFIILRVYEKGERIPLTIVDSDINKGTIDIIFQVTGKTTALLSELEEGNSVLDIVGPLGNPTHIENYGKSVMIGGGVGVAVLYPVLKALREAGNNITSILGARHKSLLILKNEIEELSDRLVLITDDGSSGKKGFVTDALLELLSQGEIFNFAYVVGPVIMMREISEITKRYNIKTEVSLNPIMVDGTGMCGACRCLIGGEERFACIDGPDFDAHKVDFDLLERRLRMFKNKEEISFNQYQKRTRHPIKRNKGISDYND